MEHELSASTWSAVGLVGTACLSSIVLSVQRRFYASDTATGSIRLAEEQPSSSITKPLKYDHVRDYTVPFADGTRLTRILFDTIVMTVLRLYDLYDAASQFPLHDKAAIYNVICIAMICISWFYILALTVVSRRYQLPNKWGFILNIHLFVYYMTSLFVSLYCLWDAFRVHHRQLTLAQGLPLILDILFSFDLFYSTGSIEQGPPFLDVDSHGKDKKPEPVAGITVASIFSFLYFNWGTPIVLGVYNNAKDIHLPSLPPTYRGYNLYYMFGAERDRSLIHRLIHANLPAIILQAITTAISAALYYGPAFFLNKLLNLIQEIDAGKQDEFYLIKGVMIVSGLSLSLMILSIVVGQLYYWGSSSLRVKVKSMLNIELYRKTLRRMGTADMHRDAKDQEDDEVPKTAAAEAANKNNAAAAAEEGQINTIGTIVNLMSTDSQRISDFTTSWFVIIESPIELFVGISFLYSLLGSSCLLGLSVMIITLPLNHYNSLMFAKTQEKLMEARDKRVSLMNEVLQGIRQIKFFAWESNWEKRVLEARDVEIKHLRTTFLSEVLFNFLWQGTPLLVTIVTFFTFTKIQGQELTAPIAFTAITVFTELRSALNSLPETFVDTLQALISVRRIESYLQEEEIAPPTTNLDPNCRVRIGFRNATVSWVDVPSDDEDDDDEEDEGDVNTTTAVNSSANNSLQIPPRSTSTYTFQSTTPAPSTYEEADTFILHNLDAHFPNGKFSVICGATGSGKTLMMLSLLGETVLLEGESFCPRTAVSDTLETDVEIPANITRKDWILDHAVAYVSQTAWLRNASIRDNILFGLPYIEKRYKETLYACALNKDMDHLEDGDATEVGEKGITLSGGQRARVALARAVYSRARNVLMDDVLSAVDAHTARHLHDKCLVGPLMEGRTRILITHHVGLCIQEASYVVHLEHGRINLCGSPQELEAQGTLESILDDVVAPTDDEEPDTIEEEVQQLDPELVKPADLKNPNTSSNTTPKQLIKEETRNVGHIKTRLYKLYFNALGGSAYWVIVFAFIIGSRALDIAESWWIKKWVASNEPSNMASTIIEKAHYFFMQQQVTSPKTIVDGGVVAAFRPAAHSRGFGLFSTTGGSDQLDMYLTIYILITMTNIVVGAGRFASLYYGTLRASKKLYQQLLQRVLRAPMRFFDTTPVGRILNRFSKDFEYIDSGVPNDLMYFLIQWLIIISAIMTVCTVLPAFVIPMALVTFLNVVIGKRFSAASRELRRMDSVTRSPLFSHFGETLVGVATIRAYGVTRQFMNEMLRRVDENARPFYYVWIANRWVGVRFSFLGAAVNFCTGIFILLSLSYMDASLAGFCLSFVLSYTTQMTMAIKRYTRLEMSFNAVERVVEFMEIEQESPAITGLRPPAHWPVEGKIDVKDLEVRYAPDLDPVLKGLTFTVNAKEKVGVVGRTGSGKSTLALSFFRFVEPTEGHILIDGIDICQIGTQDLRSNLTIIPQDPVLFSGTLRSNLDPFQEFDEESIMAALKRVELLPSDEDVDVPEQGDGHSREDLLLTSNVFTDLESPVSEGGQNFSQGQRQLICLARALLKRNRIVLMDEATASVDFETDEAIQKTIASEFADCTILCIAHRLRTVIEYDKILVLDQGEIAEFASPLDLLNTPDSIFNKMCENSGEYEALVALAKEKHELVDVL